MEGSFLIRYLKAILEVLKDMIGHCFLKAFSVYEEMGHTCNWTDGLEVS